MSSYYDLTPAQKAQITRERKKREAEAYAAALESEGKPTRATKERAMDNAVWRGAAPTGHGPAPKTKVVPTAPQSRANPKAVMRPRDRRHPPPTLSDSDEWPRNRRHPPPTLSDSDESVGAIRPPSKRKRTRQPEAELDEPADEPASFAKQANQHDNPRCARKARVQLSCRDQGAQPSSLMMMVTTRMLKTTTAGIHSFMATTMGLRPIKMKTLISLLIRMVWLSNFDLR
ncbi:hypothetical protein BC835DRAFT_1421901 [Cytidiella melzeri]|nr:hypothetical protein BC835DRAFT_1421901 [Cytidiella melzeri]